MEELKKSMEEVAQEETFEPEKTIKEGTPESEKENHEEPAPEEIVESMEDYKEELEASFRQIHAGDVMTGTVIAVDETGAILDLSYYAPGKIPAEEMSDDPHFSILESVHVGDVLTGTVTKRDDGAGNILLSRREADQELSWDKLQKMKEEKKPFTGKITELSKAGAILYVEGIRGFIPNSKLALSYVEDNSPYLNQEITVQVAEVDPEARRLILSARELLQEAAIAEKNQRIQQLTVGNIVEGKVESLKDYGAFVTIGEGISGLLHISQISDRRIKNIRSVLKEGDVVKVLITRIDNGKISLSMKAASDMLNTEKAEEEPQNYSDGGSATTSFADLLKGLKF